MCMFDHVFWIDRYGKILWKIILQKFLVVINCKFSIYIMSLIYTIVVLGTGT